MKTPNMVDAKTVSASGASGTEQPVRSIVHNSRIDQPIAELALKPARSPMNRYGFTPDTFATE